MMTENLYQKVDDLFFEKAHIHIDSASFHNICGWLQDMADITGKRDVGEMVRYLKARPLSHPVWAAVLEKVEQQRVAS